MFNKKLFVLLVFLLLILHISFVSAVENNETGVIENDTDYEPIIHDDENDFDDEDYDVTMIDFNQGDKIPITIDSPVEGNMTVLIDNKIYGSWSFSKNETILIPTYNPSSFYEDSIKNIDVGYYNLSLIFNLNTFKNYIPVVSEENSHLYFQFHTYDDTILNNKYTYVHNSELTIFEKRKTIELTLQYSYSMIVPVYFVGVGFDILLTTIKLKDVTNKHNNYSFGLILSDSKKCLYKQNISIYSSLNIMDTIGSYGESMGITCEFWYDFPSLSYDVLRNLDVCKLTVINFMDGTSDSVLINMSKFYNYVEKIDCIVNNNDVTFCFYQHFPKVFISLDELGEFVSPKDNQWNVTFNNLSYGTHVMRLYCLKTDYSKELLYKLTFEIKSLNSYDSYNNILNIPMNNISFNLFSSMFLTANGGFLVSNLDNGILNIENIIGDNLDYEFSEHKLGGESSFESKSHGSNSIGSGSSDYSSNNKVYEISEKSVSKSIDDLLTKLGLTIFSSMSLMVGYVRFEKKYQ